MQEKPMAGQDGRSNADQDRQDQRVVLAHVVDAHPAQLRLSDLIRELTDDSDDFAQRTESSEPSAASFVGACCFGVESLFCPRGQRCGSAINSLRILLNMRQAVPGGPARGSKTSRASVRGGWPEAWCKALDRAETVKRLYSDVATLQTRMAREFSDPYDPS